jgi:release factor glutamine methyltransferase
LTGEGKAPSTLAQALAHTQRLGLDRLDAQLLLQHLLGRPRSWLLAHDDAPLEPAQAQRFEALCRRRADGEPLAYLIGVWGFHGHEFIVSPDVLIPRPDTETLVDWALELLRGMDQDGAEVLDLGTGSGAIAISLALAHPSARVSATDVSGTALAIARQNIERLAPDAVTIWPGNWWQAVPDMARFDLVVSNPPYIAGDDAHLLGLAHEPRLALTPGGPGLSAIESIIMGAHRHLRQGAWLLIEHGWDQAESVRTLFTRAGYAAPTTRTDLDARERCTGAQRRA